jgi:superfamily II DNA or RNA helicase
MPLRPYQVDALARLARALNQRPILVAPTGSGKTLMAAEFVQRCDTPTLWIAHRRELIHQAAASLRSLGLDCGLILAGETPRDAQVQVASVQTLIRRTPPEAGLVIVDEAHHARAETYSGILSHYADQAIVGLTATPFRLDGRGLGEIFGALVVAAYPDELIRDGYLVPLQTYSHPAPDLRGVRIRGGDYEPGALAERMGKIVGDVVATYQKHAAGKRGIVFAVNIAHSKQQQSAFSAAGISAEHLDGGTSRFDRDAILARLRTGETQIVSQCYVLTEGWDLPALEVAIIVRPTASLCLHLQMLGRVMRACEGKTQALVFDHAGNYLRHGPADQRLTYTLDGDTTVQRTSVPSDRRCPDCYLICPRGLSECPSCGHAFATETPVHAPGELVPVTEVPFADMAAAWDAIEEQRAAYGFRDGWSFFRFRERFGRVPVVVEGKLIDPRRAGMDTKRARHQVLLAVARTRGFAPGWAAHRYREEFGVWPR